jgi:Conjugative transposon protein TcpC
LIDSVGAYVTLKARPMWRIRLVRELPRYLLCALSVAGLAASVRLTIAPPRPIRETSAVSPSAVPDRAAEGYALLFTRRYLTWNAAEPQASVNALEPFVGGGMEAGAGLGLPATGEQRVEWAEVVQVREPIANEHVYTIAAQTDAEGLLYLTIGVQRTASGVLALAGYPAFVGPPAAVAAPPASRLREVTDASLVTVVERALRNYLAKSSGELASDLTAGARVSLPTMALTLESIERMDWSADRSSVVAVLQARDGRGGQYTLTYELDVGRAQGRWEVSAVQTDPDA